MFARWLRNINFEPLVALKIVVAKVTSAKMKTYFNKFKEFNRKTHLADCKRVLAMVLLYKTYMRVANIILAGSFSKWLRTMENDEMTCKTVKVSEP